MTKKKEEEKKLSDEKKFQNIEWTDKELTKSQAERIATIFKKHKQTIGSYETLTSFKEPVMLLLRRSMNVDFYENVTKGEFEFEHSDGTFRKIYITPSRKYKFNYAGREFRGYITHEDFPFPLPEDPFMTTEMFALAQEKTLNDIKKWKAEELKAQADLWATLGWIAMGLIGIYILYKLMFAPDPNAVAAAAATAKETARTVAQNVTTAAKQVTVI